MVIYEITTEEHLDERAILADKRGIHSKNAPMLLLGQLSLNRGPICGNNQFAQLALGISEELFIACISQKLQQGIINKADLLLAGNLVEHESIGRIKSGSCGCTLGKIGGSRGIKARSVFIILAQSQVANSVLWHGIMQMQNLQLLLLLYNNVGYTAVHIELIAIVDDKIDLSCEHNNTKLIRGKGSLKL